MATEIGKDEGALQDVLPVEMVVINAVITVPGDPVLIIAQTNLDGRLSLRKFEDGECVEIGLSPAAQENLLKLLWEKRAKEVEQQTNRARAIHDAKWEAIKAAQPPGAKHWRI